MRNEERSIESAEARYRLIAEHSRDLVTVVGTDQFVRYVSPSVRSMLGVDPETAQRLGIMHFVHPDDRVTVRTAAARLFAGESESERSPGFRLVRADGTVRWCESDASSIRDASGQLQGVVVATRDITERHHFLSRVARAARMEALTRMARGVVHDAGNVMQTVVGALDAAADVVPIDSPVHAELERAHAAMERLSILLRHLASFGGSPPRRDGEARTAVDRLLQRGESAMRRLLGPRHTLRLALGAPGMETALDEAALENLTLSLIDRARASLDGAADPAGTLCIRTERALLERPLMHPFDVIPAGEWIVVQVEDSALPSVPESSGHLFDPYFAGEELGDSSGLALAAAYGYLRSSGAHLLVEESALGGTCVRMFLPKAPPSNGGVVP